MIKRKKPKENLWKLYGVRKPAKPRYTGIQGVLWAVLSEYVRRDEFARFEGLCVDGCGRRVEDWREADCGHFRASSRGLATRFKRENLGLQTKYCNNPTWSPDSSYGFGRTIDQRYGAGTADELTRLSNTIFTGFIDYDAEIKKYVALLSEL